MASEARQVRQGGRPVDTHREKVTPSSSVILPCRGPGDDPAIWGQVTWVSLPRPSHDNDQRANHQQSLTWLGLDIVSVCQAGSPLHYAQHVWAGGEAGAGQQ